MILQRSEARRFEKLFYGLIDSVAPEFGLPSTPQYPCGELTGQQVGTLVENVWGEEGDRALIDDFADRNPLRFNRTDLREIQSWKDGLFGNFVIARDGRDVLFMYGDYSFVVRGVSDEFEYEMGLDLPSACCSVVLPFAGLLTYGMVAEPLLREITPSDVADIKEAIADQKKAGHRVSTARDYAKKLPEAIESVRRLREEPLADESDADAGQAPPPDQHRGALAGMSVQERADAIEERLKTLDEHRTYAERTREYEATRADIDAECNHGPLAWSLAQALRALDDGRLRSIMVRAGIDDEGLQKRRSTLVKQLAEALIGQPEVLLYEAILCGPWAIDEVKRVVDAGSMLRFRDFGPELVDVPHAYAPCMQLFHRSHEFVCIIPREAHLALQHADWHSLRERAAVLDEAYKYLDALQDMRGVVRLDEAVAECIEHVGDIPKDVLMDLLDERLARSLGSAQAHSIEGESYLVEANVVASGVIEHLVNNAASKGENASAVFEQLRDSLDDLSGLVEAADHPGVREILKHQEGKPPYPPSKEILKYGVTAATIKTPEAQALLSYFDEHVPDGEDDYTFATEAVGAIIGTSRDLIDVEEIFKMLSDWGFVPTREQVQEMMPLLFELDKVIPKWTHNGWTARDVPVSDADEDGHRQVLLKNYNIPIRE